MKNIFIKDLKNGDLLNKEDFSIESIQMHKTRTNSIYYRLTLQDKTGEIPAKIWENNIPQCNLKDIEKGDVIKITGEVQKYNEILEINITALEKSLNYNISDLLQSSEKNIDEMYAILLSSISEIKNEHLKRLLKNIFSDEETANKFKRSPAAEFVHHDYVGGLLEHTLEMLDISKGFEKYYPEADFDLVRAGIILHDIGKIEEISLKKTAIFKTTRGKLIGHVNLGTEILDKFLDSDFPKKLAMQLKHIIISHQGELEFGSPVKPATIEAGIVHTIDYASSTVRQFQKALNLGEGRNPGFSEFQKWIGTEVYLNKDE